MLDIDIACPAGPGDDAPFRAWLGRLPLAQVLKLAVIGKTEGPATLNDFSRDLAQAAIERAIRETGSGLAVRPFGLFSTGCEGIATPLSIMIAELAEPERPATKAATGLAIGVARSEPLPLFPRCGLDHIDSAAQTVKAAIQDAQLRTDQVALVLIKSPILETAAIPPGREAVRRHAGSSGSSRGAAALGAGIALGDIDRARLSADPVGRDAVFASRVMAFSGIETDRIETIVFGERAGGDPRWGIACRGISDLLDAEGIAAIKAKVGEPHIVFFKAGIAADGRLRGHRTTVFTSDLTADKQLRAAASGLVAAHFGTTRAFISGGAEHQGPPGGCLCAALYPQA